MAIQTAWSMQTILWLENSFRGEKKGKPSYFSNLRYYLMVRFSMTSGKFSSSAFSSSNVMEPLLSLSADSNRASVRSSSFSSGREMALSLRQDFSTVRNSSGSIEPLPVNSGVYGVFFFGSIMQKQMYRCMYVYYMDRHKGELQVVRLLVY